MNIKFNPEIHPSYSQQFNKLTEAYISEKVQPLSPCACFVGNLLNNTSDWILAKQCINNLFPFDSMFYKQAKSSIIKESNGLYTVEEIIMLERLFMVVTNCFNKEERSPEQCENRLFEAFEKTLDLLKQLHIQKGEIIYEVPVFKKRVLINEP